MRWSFSTIVLVPRAEPFAPPTPVERRCTFAWARAAGFTGIELADEWLDFCNLDAPTLREIHAEITDAGLVVSGLNVPRCLFTRGPDATREYDRIEKALTAASLLSTEVVNLSLSVPRSPGSNAETRSLRGADASTAEQQRAAEGVALLASKAALAGLKIAVELHDDGLLDSPELCLQLLHRVKLPSLGINPDVANLCRGPGPLPDWRRSFKLLAPHAINWHVKNYRQFQPVALEAGDIDYNVACDLMRAAGYTGWVSIESRLGDAAAVQCAGLAYLKSLLTSSLPPLSR